MLDANLDRPAADLPREDHPARRARRLARRQRQVAPSSPSCSTRSPRCPTRSPSSRRRRRRARPSFAHRPRRHRRRGALRRHPAGPRVHLAGARAAAGRRPPVEGGGRAARADARTSTASYRFETYFSLSCQNCPDVVQALNLMSVLNPQHHATSPSTARCSRTRSTRARCMAVPTVFLNGELFGQGRMSLEQIVAKLDTGAAERDAAERSTPRTPSTCSSSAAARPARPPPIYAARKGIRTGVRRRALRRPGARHHGHRELHLGAATPRARSSPPRSSSTSRELRRRHHEPAARRPSWCPPTEAGGLHRRSSWPTAPSLRVAHRRPVDRRALAHDERARRGRVPQQGRDLLPALRRPAVQGQARRGDRRRQLRRRGRDRPGRHRRARHPDRVRRRAAGRRGAAAQAAQPAQRRRHRSAPLTTEVRRRRRRRSPACVYEDRATGDDARSVDLEGIFVQIGLLPNTEWLEGTRRAVAARRDRRSTTAARPRCPACSPPATAPPCRTSRSSSPWAPASTAALQRLRPPDPHVGARRTDRPAMVSSGGARRHGLTVVGRSRFGNLPAGRGPVTSLRGYPPRCDDGTQTRLARGRGGRRAPRRRPGRGARGGQCARHQRRAGRRHGCRARGGRRGGPRGAAPDDRGRRRPAHRAHPCRPRRAAPRPSTPPRPATAGPPSPCARAPATSTTTPTASPATPRPSRSPRRARAAPCGPSTTSPQPCAAGTR